MTLEEFELYHEENPHLFEVFEKYTFDVIAKGRKYFSAEMIINRIRWYSQVEANNDRFKINNDAKPYYARLFEHKHPQHKGFFRKRRAYADEGVLNAG